MSGHDEYDPDEFIGPPPGNVALFEQDESAEEIADLHCEVRTEEVRTKLQEKKALQDLARQSQGETPLSARLYSYDLTGSKVYMSKLTDIDSYMDDFESHLQGLITNNSEWPGGKWGVQIINEKNKIMRNMTYQFPEKPKTSPVAPESEALRNSVVQNADLTGKMLEMVAAKNNGGVDASTQALIEMLKGKPDAMEEMVRFTSIMKAMQPEQRQESPVLLALVTAVAPALAAVLTGALKPQKNTGIEDTLKILKDQGLIGDQNPQKVFEAAMKQVTTFMEMSRALSPASESSPITEIIRHLGPHIGETLSNVAAGAADLVKAKREALAIEAGKYGQRRQVAHQPHATQPAAGTETAVNQTLKDIQDAVIAKNKSFFPRLEAIIANQWGDKVVPSLIDGEMKIHEFVSQVAQNLSPYAPKFGEPEFQAEMVVYMTMFVDSKLDEIKESTVYTVCQKCGSPWEFNSVADFEGDSQICSADCDGKLTIVADEALTEPIPAQPETVADPIDNPDAEKLEATGDNGKEVNTSETAADNKVDNE